MNTNPQQFHHFQLRKIYFALFLNDLAVLTQPIFGYIPTSQALCCHQSVQNKHYALLQVPCQIHLLKHLQDEYEFQL